MRKVVSNVAFLQLCWEVLHHHFSVGPSTEEGRLIPTSASASSPLVTLTRTDIFLRFIARRPVTFAVTVAVGPPSGKAR